MKQIRKFIIMCLIVINVPLVLLFVVYPKKISRVYGADYIISQDLIWNTNTHSLIDGMYLCEGWVLLPGIEQGYAVLDNKSIWLFDTNNKVFYRLDAKQSSNRSTDVSNAINDGVDYQSSYFTVNVNLNEINLKNKHFDIFIAYQYHATNYLVKTNASINNGNLIQRD